MERDAAREELRGTTRQVDWLNRDNSRLREDNARLRSDVEGLRGKAENESRAADAMYDALESARARAANVPDPDDREQAQALQDKMVSGLVDTERDKAVVAEALEQRGLQDTVLAARRLTECPPEQGLVEWLQSRMAEGNKVREELAEAKSDVTWADRITRVEGRYADGRLAQLEKERDKQKSRADWRDGLLIQIRSITGAVVGPELVASVQRLKEQRDKLRADVEERNVRIQQLEGVAEERFEAQRRLEADVEEMARCHKEELRVEADLRLEAQDELEQRKAELRGMTIAAADDTGYQANRIAGLQADLDRAVEQREALRSGVVEKEAEIVRLREQLRTAERGRRNAVQDLRIAERERDEWKGKATQYDRERASAQRELGEANKSLRHLRLTRGYADAAGPDVAPEHTMAGLPQSGWAKTDGSGFPGEWHTALDDRDAMDAAQHNAPAYATLVSVDGKRMFMLYDEGFESGWHTSTDGCCAEWLKRQEGHDANHVRVEGE